MFSSIITRAIWVVLISIRINTIQLLYEETHPDLLPHRDPSTRSHLLRSNHEQSFNLNPISDHCHLNIFKLKPKQFSRLKATHD